MPAAFAEARSVAFGTNPNDYDGDGLRNRRDTDDDNDGLLDLIDPFGFDASNGRGVRIDAGSVLLLNFAGAALATAGSNGWGFGMTGLASNGVSTPERLGLGQPALTFAGGALHIEDAGIGTLIADTLLYGAQFGIDPNARVLAIGATFDNPYDSQAAVAGNAFGLVIGSGDQDNYLRLAIETLVNGTLALRLSAEIGGVAWAPGTIDLGINVAALAGAGDEVTLGFTVDTVTGVLRADWSIDTLAGTVAGTGPAIALSGALLAAVRGDAVVGGQGVGLAVGIAATSGLGAPLDLDVLFFQVEGSAGDPDIVLTGRDAPFLTDRVVFNWIDDPSQNSIPDREYKEAGTVRITNSGVGPMDLSRLVLDGPFKFLDASDLRVQSLAAGASLDIEIGFDRTKFVQPERGTGAQFAGHLTVLSNDPDEPTAMIDLAGWWQTLPEAGREPGLNDILAIFGFGNRVDPAVLANGGLYEKAAPEEVLAPYWKLAAGYTAATVVQIASFEDAGISTFGIHAPSSMTTSKTVLQQDDLENQSFFPLLSDFSTQTKTINAAFIPDSWTGDDWFGFRSSGNSSDPTLNRTTKPGADLRGHFMRIFAAEDADGNAIPDTYIIALDMNGSNLDYNDTVYVISGITPVTELLIG